MDRPEQPPPPDAWPERWFVLTLMLVAGAEVMLLAAWLAL
jgi:hypothetical protein